MAELKARYPNDNLQFELIVGSRGVFDVRVGETLLFSKHQEGRFPMLGEVSKKLLPHL